MRYSKLKISAEATGRLRPIRQRTGLTPNLLCRAAILLSLEEGPVNALAPDEKGQEFNAYTLTAEHTGLIAALLRFVEQEEDGPELSDQEMTARLRAHIHRGVRTLGVRVKSPADFARLGLAA
jgi:DNA sulfur modification protein DndE